MLRTVRRAETYDVGDRWLTQKGLLDRYLQCALMKLWYLRTPAELCAIFPFFFFFLFFAVSNAVLFTTDVL